MIFQSGLVKLFCTNVVVYTFCEGILKVIARSFLSTLYDSSQPLSIIPNEKQITPNNQFME